MAEPQRFSYPDLVNFPTHAGRMSVTQFASSVTFTDVALAGRDWAGAALIHQPDNAGPVLVGFMAEGATQGVYENLTLPLAAPYNGATITGGKFYIMFGEASADAASVASMLGYIRTLFQQNFGLFGHYSDINDVSQLRNNSLLWDSGSKRFLNYRNGIFTALDISRIGNPKGRWDGSATKTALAASGTIAVNFNNGPHFSVTHTNNFTMALPTNVAVGSIYFVTFIASGGGHTAAFASGHSGLAASAINVADGAKTRLKFEVTAHTGGTATAVTVSAVEYAENDIVEEGGYLFMSNIDANTDYPRFSGGNPISTDSWTFLPTQVLLSGSFALTGIISPAQLTADQNNYSPTGLTDAFEIRHSLNADRIITGMAGGATGRMLVHTNLETTRYLILEGESASSSAANRFAETIVIPPGASQLTRYDNAAQRWRAVGTAGGRISGAISFPSDVTPAQITAATNNYAPAGLSTAAVLRLSTDASRNLTGLTGGFDGRVLYLLNVGSFDLVLIAESASSTAANRFAFADDVVIRPGQGISLIYDTTSSRWRRDDAPQEGRIDGETSIAAATTTNIGASTTERVLITGTVSTAITSWGASPRKRRYVRYQGYVMVTPNGTSLITIDGLPCLMYPGDVSMWVSDASGNWRELSRETANNRLPHDIADSDPFPSILHKPAIHAKFSSLQYLPAGWTFERNSVAYRQRKDGLLELMPANCPRFHTEWSTGVSGYLHEITRTNIILYSQEFGNAAWTRASGVTQSANVAVGPDGLTEADKVTEAAAGAGGTQHTIFQNLSGLADATTYNASVYVKPAGRNYAIMTFATGVMPTTAIIVDFTNATVAVATGSPILPFIEVLPNGWFRIGLGVLTTGAGTGRITIQIANDPVYANRVYTGDGSSGLFVWGAQVEAGDGGATSYIPTTSAAAGRVTDRLYMVLLSWISLAQEFTMAERYALLAHDTANRYMLSLDDGTTGNRINFYNSSGPNVIAVVVNGSTQASYNTAVGTALGDYVRASLRAKPNDASASFNGGAAGATDTSVSMFVPTHLWIGSRAFGSAPVVRMIASQVDLYTKGLSNAQLQVLTT
jgi:hypothetical protein